MIVKEIKASMDEDYTKNDDVIIKEVLVFRNGNVAVFDQHRRQVAFLQGVLRGAKFELQ